MARDRVLLAVDFSYQNYRACAAHPDLHSVREVYTGGVYGFLQSFGKAVRETGATDVIVCDDVKPYVRSQTYPEYKALRASTMDPDLKERFNVTKPLLFDLFNVCGVPVWRVPGYEADDLTGHVVRTRASRFDRMFAMAKDSDLWQLMEFEHFGVYLNSIDDVQTRATLLRDYQLTPAEYTLATALSGTHNGVAGIPGVGEKRSRAAVKDPALMRKYRGTHADIIDRNISLIKLPHASFARDTPMPVRTKRFSERDLYRWCAVLDIDCTFSMVQAFSQIDNQGRR